MNGKVDLNINCIDLLISIVHKVVPEIDVWIGSLLKRKVKDPRETYRDFIKDNTSSFPL